MHAYKLKLFNFREQKAPFPVRSGPKLFRNFHGSKCHLNDIRNKIFPMGQPTEVPSQMRRLRPTDLNGAGRCEW